MTRTETIAMVILTAVATLTAIAAFVIHFIR